MKPRPSSAEEGPLSWIERWSPEDAELWWQWRRSLSRQQGAGTLLSLQAALSGLVAFRRPEHHPVSAPGDDCRPQLHAVRATYAWALELARELQSGDGSRPPLRAVQSSGRGPETSLDALCRSLRDALRICERLLDLPIVDAGVFGSSCDFFLRDLRRNAFFDPPEPLEFVDAAELLGAERFLVGFDASKRDASKTATVVAFLALLRCHRFLGIADDQMAELDGLYRAHVVMAGARRELRTLIRFLVLQDAEAFAGRLERDLTSLAAHEIDNPLPAPNVSRGLALAAERTRNEIRELRRSVKATARRLRDIEAPSLPERNERQSGRVRKSLHQEVWAFRFILRAFLAKASALPVVEGIHDPGQLAFAGEFVRHFRAFGPRLAKGTEYPHRGPLTTAVSALTRREAIDEETLAFAIEECERFAEHLERALTDDAGLSRNAFDKREAADALRAYLTSAKEHVPAERPPTGTFGGFGPSAPKVG